MKKHLHFFDLEDFKIENNGIWISKDELDRLFEKYDSEYTNLYRRQVSDERFKDRELLKTNIKYHIAKELSDLISND